MDKTRPQVENREHPHPKLTGKTAITDAVTASHDQARTITGVFMFGSRVQKTAKTKCLLTVLQEVPSHHKHLGYRTKVTKKPRRLNMWKTQVRI